MESIGVISKVFEPFSWCADMVAIPKKSGSIRICVDLKPLIESVWREVHPLYRGLMKSWLSWLEQKCSQSLTPILGFGKSPWLPSPNINLTTFITPFGRYRFNKLPFGICSAPEHFQRRMSQVLMGLARVVSLIDDILMFGSTEAEHDSRLDAVMKRIESAGVTLNLEKCSFQQCNLKFLGDDRGISADPAKTSAILNMPNPHNVSDLQRFLGMVNQLGKFSSRLSELTHPLRRLLSSKQAWVWDFTLEAAFLRVKTAGNKEFSRCLCTWARGSVAKD